MFTEIVLRILSIPKTELYSTKVEPFLFKTLEETGFLSSTYVSSIYQIINVAIAYHLLYLTSAHVIYPIFNKWRISKATTEQEKNELKKTLETSKNQQQVAMHIVSFLQSVIILELCWTAFFKYQEYYLCITPWINYKKTVVESSNIRLFGNTYENNIVCVMACGYFLWDIFISMYCSTLPFVMHGIVSFTVYSIGLQPFINYYACIFLFFELSNPFLNLRWFAIKYDINKSGKNKLLNIFLKLNELVFVIVFFHCRILWGLLQITLLVYDFWLQWNDKRMNVIYAAIIISGNALLNCLNIYWFSTMIKIACSKLKSAKSKSD